MRKRTESRKAEVFVIQPIRNVSMWLSLIASLLGIANIASSDREAAVVEACRAWNRPGSARVLPVHRVAPDGLCFSGEINSASSAAFVDALATLEPATPLVIVVHSNGGEINAGIAMGEALAPLKTTVVAQRVCASSCANYLFTAGDRRVIDDDALLLFHGGAHPIDEGALRKAIGSQIPADQVEAQVANIRADIDRQIRRQDAFSTMARIDVNFFRWMASFNDLPEDAFLTLCPTRDPVMILYSDRLLAMHGVAVHENRGPNSQEALTARVAALGRAEPVCFME
ncbi:hypothetical protein B7G68_09265 [Caulobacter segnis]|uniref:Uncharacterized protein n=2 Tax=Caulobacter segnis TaxID=88688 RepID=D5VGG0_CAUST|nr:ATP-dependent Clp protease proteolytic subunit [Caulobacter segnis]ADG10279.1 hypothetical protein Cseg_1804 [Caulobacter segnis ATCC 21756]AVQ02016.1 hypothetical protein B7G68_09265 [Caulobacter segnis]